MKQKTQLKLFWKFAIAILIIVALFGSINLYFINYTIFRLFEDELNRNGINTATSIAERSIDPIVYDDLATLNKLVSDQMRIDSNLAYIFILNGKMKVIAHTFEERVPQNLITTNLPSGVTKSSTLRIKDQKNRSIEIRDIAVPILDGTLGFVRMGLYEEAYTHRLKTTSNIFLLMVVTFLCFGIIGAFFFSMIITKPIRVISHIAEKINIDNLVKQENDYLPLLRSKELVKYKNLLQTTDEIDVLIFQFSQMVSRLSQTYADLQQVQANFMQSEKMASLGTLSAGLAHEINNPITGLQNCLRRIAESPDNIRQNILYIEMMSEAVIKIEKVVGNLLNFSRKQEMIFERFSMNRTLENVLMLTSFQLEKLRISIIKEQDDQATFIYASTNHIEQIILNLVLNSIEAIEDRKMIENSHEGEIVFRIFTEENCTKFEISDNGIGLADNNLKAIFDPFFTQKKVRQGTGLGLAVSYSIIKQHNAQIEASINTKGGLTMSLSFPKTNQA